MVVPRCDDRVVEGTDVATCTVRNTWEVVLVRCNTRHAGNGDVGDVPVDEVVGADVQTLEATRRSVSWQVAERELRAVIVLTGATVLCELTWDCGAVVE